MSKTGDSFVPQMDAKAMRAFSRAGKRKQNLAALGATTSQNVADARGDHEVSSTTISDKPFPKRVCPPPGPTSASGNKEGNAESSQPFGEKTIVITPPPPKWWHWFQGYEGKGGSEVASVFDRRFPTDQIIQSYLNKHDDHLRVNKVGLVNTAKIAQSFCLQNAFLNYALKSGISTMEGELVEKNKLLKEQAEEIAKAWLVNTELESLHKKLQDVNLQKDKLQGDLNKCKKDKESCDVLLEQRTASLKDASEKLKSAEEKLAAEQVGRKTDTHNLKVEIFVQYEVGFEKAVGQVKFLYPDLNVDEVGAFKEIKDGKLVEIPDDEE
ncbi:hypothetical protein SESBI_24880 [Sesbania bispinosa]|nr:hypothetical protein SESBI_24880 [Sesbania bispinosa]